MTLALNTTHPLYGNLLSFICVSDGQVVDLKQPAATLTVNAAVTIGSGAYGTHFQTSNSGDSALGVSISSGHAHSLSQSNDRTLLVVTNGNVSSGGRRYLGGQQSGHVAGTIGIDGTTGAATLRNSTGVVGTGTTDVRTGAHSLAVTRNSTTAWALVVDGNTESSGATSYVDEATNKIDLIGGGGGGRGYWSNKFVYFIWFDKVLSGAELVDLHASLGADNAFALLEASATAAPPSGTVTIGTITPSTTSASVSYTYSAADQTGFEYRLDAGTPATLDASPATITGLTAGTEYDIEVRAINADGPGAWSAPVTFQTATVAPTPGWSVDPAITSRTTTSYTLSATPSVACTVYAVAVQAGSGAPSAAQIVAGTDAADSPAAATDSAASSGNAVSLTLSGLGADPTYDIHVVGYTAP